MAKNDNKNVRCSFCGKPQNSVKKVEEFKKLIYNPDGTTNSIAKKLDQEFDIMGVEAKEDNGNWIPTVNLKNGDDNNLQRI